MGQNFVTERPTSNLYLTFIFNNTDCLAHHASIGVPCWFLADASGVYLVGICNARAERAGYIYREPKVTQSSHKPKFFKKSKEKK